MPDFPPVRFLGSSFLGEVSLADLDPHSAIPLERPGGEKTSFFPLLTYFHVIEQAIRKNEGEALLAALQTRLGRPVALSEIREIRIYSEKHGSDYHPAKIEARFRDRVWSFVMNVALTERGRQVLTSEFQVLDELQRRGRLPYLPPAYFIEETSADCGPAGRWPVQMYLADWLEGFYEFHLSSDPADGKQKVVLWDAAGPNHFFPPSTADQIYREIARILTSYYDWPTFSQIHPWHLAAGDFIARIEADRAEVRLVAARQYGPLIGPPDLPPEEALLFFLLNMTIRIRLDRLNGVGDLAWADERCLKPALEGFFLALGEKEQTGGLPREFVAYFRNYLESMAVEEIKTYLAALRDSFDQCAPDLPLIKMHWEQHLNQFLSLTR
ncbi:MAG: hypothetical protein HY892_17550 [Deltaproteobacteria bacterium]|nr:hypothetical protein [Deltaproteobacteria bacterium]